MYYIASLANLATAACSTEWAHRQDQWEGNNYVVRKEAEAHCFTTYFGRDFLSLRTTIFSGIKNHPNASMSCCSDDLAQLHEW